MDAMTLVAYLCGNNLGCLRCKRTSHSCVQVRIQEQDSENAGREFQIGDDILLSNIDADCATFQPWNEEHPLNIVTGLWDCTLCGLASQYAKARFGVHKVRLRTSTKVVFDAVLEDLTRFVPTSLHDFADVHYVDLELMWAHAPDLLTKGGDTVYFFDRLSLSEKERALDQVVTSYREFLREVGVQY
jgi:hypothetical protein